jgi:hypothetical protein
MVMVWVRCLARLWLRRTGWVVALVPLDSVVVLLLPLVVWARKAGIFRCALHHEKHSFVKGP